MDVQIRSQLNKGGMLAQTPQQPHTHHSQRIAGPLARWGPLKAQEREWAGSASTAVLMHCAAKTAPNVGVEEDHAGSAFAAMHCNATLFFVLFFSFTATSYECVRTCVCAVCLPTCTQYTCWDNVSGAKGRRRDRTQEAKKPELRGPDEALPAAHRAAAPPPLFSLGAKTDRQKQRSIPLF